MEETNKTVPVHYIKGSQCRNLAVQGIFGGMNPLNGQFHMATFVERPPIPQEITYDEMAQEVARSGKVGVVREIDAILHFDIATAIAISRWLDGRISEFLAAHPEVNLGGPSK